MSAIPEDFIKKTSELSGEVTRPFANSRKIHAEGSRPDIRVPMREVQQTPTTTNGTNEPNPPIYIYDTSGPYGDPAVKIDLLKGMPDVRSGWIVERDDTEQLSGPSSEFGQARQSDPELAQLRFEHIRAPRRARARATRRSPSSPSSEASCRSHPAQKAASPAPVITSCSPSIETLISGSST